MRLTEATTGKEKVLFEKYHWATNVIKTETRRNAENMAMFIRLEAENPNSILAALSRQAMEPLFCVNCLDQKNNIEMTEWQNIKKKVDGKR